MSDEDTISDVLWPMQFEYETQFYNFTPQGFVKGIRAIFNDALNEKLAKLKEDISTKCPGTMSEADLDKAVNEVRHRMKNFMQTRFPSFQEHVLHSILTIPPYVCLPADKVHEDERLASLNKRAIEASNKELEKELASLTLVNNQLAEELKIITSVREAQEKAKSRLQQAMEMGNQLEQSRQADQEVVNAMLKMLEGETKKTK